MISGIASGSSIRQNSWRLVIPIPRPASRTEAGHVGEPDDHVAVDDLQRVERQRDDRRDRAATGDRQQQREQGDARQRVEDPGGAGERRDQPAPPCETSASAKAIKKPITTETDTSTMCSSSGVT